MLGEFVLTLSSALEGKYISFDESEALLMGLVKDIENPSLWLIELSCKSDVDGMVDMLNLRFPIRENREEEIELTLGFLYKSYKERKITKAELLAALVDCCDASGFSGFSPEFICDIFKGDDVDGRLGKLLSRYVFQSERALEYLNSKAFLVDERELFYE